MCEQKMFVNLMFIEFEENLAYDSKFITPENREKGVNKYPHLLSEISCLFRSR